MKENRSIASGSGFFVRLFLWTGVVCVACAWTCWSGVYVSTYILAPFEDWFAYLIAIAGILAFMGALTKIELTIARSYYFILAPLLFFALLIPYPYSIGPWVLIGGLVVFFWGKRETFARRITPGILFSGLVMTVMTCLVPAWYYLGCHGNGLPHLASFLSHAISFLGADAASSGHTLFVRCAEDYRLIQITADSMGLLPGLFILTGIFICWISNVIEGTKRNLFKMLVIWVLYMPVRYLILLCIFLGWPDQTTISMMWNPVYSVLSFMPLAVMLAICLTGTHLTGMVHLAWARLSMRSLGFISLTAFAVGAMIVGGALTDPGMEKIGRVLIDESHSDWEDTMRPLDTNWYGMSSTYNYYSLRTFLEHYYRVEISFREITPDVLMFQDVVVLKCPTRAYTESEQEALVSFVKRGGGLFLIGDHTDVFGSSTFLNALAERFGLSFDKNGQWDINGQFSIYNRPKTLSHPVGKQTPEFLFATGCTLSAPLWAEKAIIGYGMMTREANYRNEGFFPDQTHYEDREFGLFLQMAGNYYGRGRVLCFSDSTVWSNFSMFLLGKPELLLDSLSWLNRSNTWWASAKPYVLLFSIIVALAGIFQMVFSGFLRRRHATVLTAFLTVIPMACLSVDLLHDQSYQHPEPMHDYKKITFDLSHSDIFLANRFWFPPHNSYEKSYDAFFVAVQRISMTPQVRNDFVLALEKGGDPIVIINPYREFTEHEVSAFQKYISQGGRALILDASDRTRHSFSWQLSKPFGMEIVYDSPDVGAKDEPKGQAIYTFSENRDRRLSVSFPTKGVGRINGGKPRLWYTSGQNKDESDSASWAPCLSEVPSGEGKVWLCTLARAFSDSSLGTSGAIPNNHQQNIYRLVYQILTDLADS
jgi:hypothetical protein